MPAIAKSGLPPPLPPATAAISFTSLPAARPAPAPPCRRPQPAYVLPSVSPITGRNRRRRLVARIVAQLAQRICRRPRQIQREDLYAVHLLGVLKQAVAFWPCCLCLRSSSSFCTDLSSAVTAAARAGRSCDIAYLQRARRLVEHIGFFIQQAQHAVACRALDAADTRRHAGFGQNLEAAQLGRIRHVRTAAEFRRNSRSTSTTRTISPYFSPNSAIAPSSLASLQGHHLARVRAAPRRSLR